MAIDDLSICQLKNRLRKCRKKVNALSNLSTTIPINPDNTYNLCDPDFTGTHFVVRSGSGYIKTSERVSASELLKSSNSLNICITNFYNKDDIPSNCLIPPVSLTDINNNLDKGFKNQLKLSIGGINTNTTALNKFDLQDYQLKRFKSTDYWTKINDYFNNNKNPSISKGWWEDTKAKLDTAFTTNNQKKDDAIKNTSEILLPKISKFSNAAEIKKYTDTINAVKSNISGASSNLLTVQKDLNELSTSLARGFSSGGGTLVPLMSGFGGGSTNAQAWIKDLYQDKSRASQMALPSWTSWPLSPNPNIKPFWSPSQPYDIEKNMWTRWYNQQLLINTTSTTLLDDVNTITPPTSFSSLEPTEENVQKFLIDSLSTLKNSELVGVLDNKYIEIAIPETLANNPQREGINFYYLKALTYQDVSQEATSPFIAGTTAIKIEKDTPNDVGVQYPISGTFYIVEIKNDQLDNAIVSNNTIIDKYLKFDDPRNYWNFLTNDVGLQSDQLYKNTFTQIMIDQDNNIWLGMNVFPDSPAETNALTLFDQERSGDPPAANGSTPLLSPFDEIEDNKRFVNFVLMPFVEIVTS